MTDARTPIDELNYVHYEEYKEEIPKGEEEAIQKIKDDLRQNNVRAFHKYGHAIRDAHAKSHGILYGELTVLPDLPEHLRQGIFAEPGRKYPIIARMSTTSGLIRSDQVRGVRGLGLKVIGVTGDRVDKENFPGSNQDFVFVTEPEFPFKDAVDYSKSGMRSAKALARIPDSGMRVLNTVLHATKGLLSIVGAKLPLKLDVFAGKNTKTLGIPFYTAAPIQYGKYIAKLSVEPKSESVTALKGETVAKGSEAHTDAVVDFFKENSAEYLVSAQLCTSLKDMPIENAKKPWSTKASPYQPIATITYLRQNPYSPERRIFGDDVLSFNSWRAIVDHRPLGSINRLKKEVYEASSKYRHAMNFVEHREPGKDDVLPG
jgi:Catalase